MNKKIAIPTDDGETISRHFGKARYFKVVTLGEGDALQDELREKSGGHGDDHAHPEQEHGRAHGGKFSLLQDCDTLIGAGMGQPAYDRLQKMGLEVILTGEKQIADALKKYRAGELENDMRRVHAHHDHDHDHGRQDIHFVDNA